MNLACKAATQKPPYTFGLEASGGFGPLAA
jgi:hypothetical protein